VHIVHVSGLAPKKYGGMEKFLLRLGKQAIAKGHRFSLIWAGYPAAEQLNADLKDANIKSIVMPASGRQLRFIWELSKWLRNNHCDLLHTHFNPVAILALAAAKIGGVRVAVSSIHHDISPSEVGIFDLRHRIPIKVRSLLSKRVLMVSRMVQDNFVMVGLNRKKCLVHYLGIDAGTPTVSREQIRREFGIKDDETAIVCIAFHSPIKGVDILIEAMGILAKDFPKVCLLQVGSTKNPSETDVLKELSNKLGIKNRVIWAGYRNDIADILQGGDIYCQPSRSEALPLAILEAMSMQLPVVATRVGGVPEAVEDGVTGLLVSSESPSELAAGIAVLLKDPEKCKKMGAVGKQKVKNEFDLTLQNEKLIKLYESLVLEK
jgi:glycosyltransferase involved in cell wall biosynthesis